MREAIARNSSLRPTNSLESSIIPAATKGLEGSDPEVM
ncbi:hypothetical protein NIES4073_33910 [Kalymmatonema gypsitolerans NIES-4073]|nr:hypothetical protein NIES4073_33910 [Scytonema sp. NIES-4073]